MAGHSRWAQVKHKKALSDAKRGALFSKHARLISIAAREGGGDPEFNPRLRAAMEQARGEGMPKDNIERALARGLGATEGAALTAREYEAYGPGGSAFLIQAVTDNPNRTTNEVKSILAEFGGKLARAGSVAWLFERKAVVEFWAPARGAVEAEELTLIDEGAEDIRRDGENLQALVAPVYLEPFRRAARERGLTPTAVRFAAIAKGTVALSPEDQGRTKALSEALDEHPDVTAVWTNIADDEPIK